MLIAGANKANYLQPCKHYSAMGIKTPPFVLPTDSKILESQKKKVWAVQFSDLSCRTIRSFQQESLHRGRPLLISMRGAVVKLHSAKVLHKRSMCKAAAATVFDCSARQCGCKVKKKKWCPSLTICSFMWPGQSTQDLTQSHEGMH